MIFWGIVVLAYVIVGLVIGGFVEAWTGREHTLGWYIYAIVSWPICIVLVIAEFFINFGHKLCEKVRNGKDKEQDRKG